MRQRVPAKCCTAKTIKKESRAYFVLKMKYPRVNEHLDEWKPLIWILNKDFPDQVLVVF